MIKHLYCKKISREPVVPGGRLVRPARGDEEMRLAVMGRDGVGVAGAILRRTVAMPLRGTFVPGQGMKHIT